MSFKRRLPSKQISLPPGTHLSPSSPSTILVSTGIPSLDDILGGGLPLSCLFTTLAPDNHSAYGTLVQKYFVSQGIACGQRVCLVDDNGLSFARECVWMPTAGSTTSLPPHNEGEEKSAQIDERIKIAWRYEQMKKFQTTVSSGSSSSEDFCLTFDLTCSVPPCVIEDACSSERLIFMESNIRDDVEASIRSLLRRIRDTLSVASSATELIRLCIPALGSPQWGDVEPAHVIYFLHSLRHLLHQYPQGCASVSLAPHMCTDAWGGYGWLQKIGWLTDAALTMSGFGANPSLVTLFPSHNGLVQIHKTPAPHTILPPSDKYSTLRGLSSSAGVDAGSGENNLAFRCTRKRLIIETMHLDLEGGVAERRTTPSSNATSLDAGLAQEKANMASRGDHSLATVKVEIEKAAEVISTSASSPSTNTTKVKKPGKRVTFHSDRPDLYDF